MRSSTAEKDTIIILQKLFCSDVNTNIDIGNKFHAFLFHQLQSAVNDLFLQLHVRNAVAEKSSDTVVSLKYGYAVATAVQLLCGCQSGRTTSYYRHFLSGTDLRSLWLYPAHLVSMFDDRALIFLCRYRFSVQITGTGCLAECRADT